MHSHQLNHSGHSGRRSGRIRGRKRTGNRGNAGVHGLAKHHPPSRRIRLNRVTRIGHPPGGIHVHQPLLSIEPDWTMSRDDDDASIEIHAEDSATFNLLVENDVMVRDITMDYLELAPDPQVEGVGSDSQLFGMSAIEHSFTETEAVFASLQRELQEEKDAAEWEAVLQMPRQSGAERPDDVSETPPGRRQNADPETMIGHHTDGDIPPAPPPIWNQHTLILESLTQPEDLAGVATDERQIVRTSMPPDPRRSRMRSIRRLQLAVSLTIVFAGILTLLITQRNHGWGRQNEVIHTIAAPNPSGRSSAASADDPALPLNMPMHQPTVHEDILPEDSVGSTSNSMQFSLEEVALNNLTTKPIGHRNRDVRTSSVIPKSAPPKSTAGASMENNSSVSASAALPENDAPLHPQAEMAAQAPEAPDNTTGKSASSPSGQLPMVPSRTAVKNAMTRVARQIDRCRSYQPNEMLMSVSFSGATGEVTSARVLSEGYHGTPAEQCALRAVRHVRVPQFEKPQLVVKYPF